MMKATLIGLLVTIVLYFVPVVDLIAPLIGGAVAGYLLDRGIGGGLVAGALLAVLMLIPGLGIAVALGLILGALGVPVLGGIAGAAWFIVYLLIIGHTLVLGLMGSAIGGAIADYRRRGAA
jgi:hypothetical protein